MGKEIVENLEIKALNFYWINDAQERTGESNGGHGCIISHALSNVSLALTLPYLLS